MPLREVADIDELKKLEGTDVAVGDWFEVSQKRINDFAEATGDHQWIHTDPERCKKESPFGGAIAHGYLTLSLFPMLIAQTFRLKQAFKMGVNYGLNKLRFMSPVPAGGRIRPNMRLASVNQVEGGYQVQWRVTVEIENKDKPACVADVIYRYYE